MIKHWFETDKSASLLAIIEILESKMGMSLDAYEDQVTKGVVGQLGSSLQETDIEQVLTQLGRSLPKIARILTKGSTRAGDRAKVQHSLREWIVHEREDATWSALIKILEKIDSNAARKIKAMRMEKTVQEVNSCTVEMDEDDQSSMVIVIPA